jgi:hypothetical protein
MKNVGVAILFLIASTECAIAAIDPRDNITAEPDVPPIVLTGCVIYQDISHKKPRTVIACYDGELAGR